MIVTILSLEGCHGTLRDTRAPAERATHKPEAVLSGLGRLAGVRSVMSQLTRELLIWRLCCCVEERLLLFDCVGIERSAVLRPRSPDHHRQSA